LVRESKVRPFTPRVNFTNILRALFCQYPFAKKLQSQTVASEKLHEALWYKKCARTMLMKLNTRVPVIFEKGDLGQCNDLYL